MRRGCEAVEAKWCDSLGSVQHDPCLEAYLAEVFQRSFPSRFLVRGKNLP